MLIDCVCPICGTEFKSKPSTIKKGSGKFCSIPCGLKSRTVTLEQRFKKYVGATMPNGCRHWKGARLPHGYGIISAGTKANPLVRRAHCVAWELVHGPVPDGMCVLHKCDRPSCVNVEHLFLGTQEDNIQDMVSKERQSRGSKHARARMTEEDVLSMRRRYKSGEATQRQLAREYGYAADYISKVINGTYWKHVPLM